MRGMILDENTRVEITNGQLDYILVAAVGRHNVAFMNSHNPDYLAEILVAVRTLVNRKLGLDREYGFLDRNFNPAALNYGDRGILERYEGGGLAVQFKDLDHYRRTKLCSEMLVQTVYRDGGMVRCGSETEMMYNPLPGFTGPWFDLQWIVSCHTCQCGKAWECEERYEDVLEYRDKVRSLVMPSMEIVCDPYSGDSAVHVFLLKSIVDRAVKGIQRLNGQVTRWNNRSGIDVEFSSLTNKEYDIVSDFNLPTDDARQVILIYRTLSAVRDVDNAELLYTAYDMARFRHM